MVMEIDASIVWLTKRKNAWLGCSWRRRLHVKSFKADARRGTLENGQKEVPYDAHKLSNGDMLRDEELDLVK